MNAAGCGRSAGLAHGLRAGGAPKCSNYALSRIGMANTIFLVDLYFECINLRYHVFSSNKLVALACKVGNEAAAATRIDCY
jgi:hypothetical protein